MIRLVTILTLLAAAAPLPAAEFGDLDRSITAEDGWVHLAYAAGEDVHVGDCHVTIIDGNEVTVSDREYSDGLVHVTVRVRDGEPDRMEVRANRRPTRREREARDLGEVDVATAATYFLDLARRTDRSELAEDAIVAAALADTEVWPDLLEFARDRNRSTDVRQAAIFWLGMAAGDKVEHELEAIAADDSEEIEVREHAVFALHQALESDTGHALETLGRIATENPHPQVRQSALFWLAQHDDPAVVDLFESILLD